MSWEWIPVQISGALGYQGGFYDSEGAPDRSNGARNALLLTGVNEA